MTHSLETSSGTFLLFPDAKEKPAENTRLLFASPQNGEDSQAISWPGEYDHDGVSIRAIGKSDSVQISYIITAEGIRCGFMSSPLQEFSEAEEEAIGDLDVLVFPADDVKKAQKLLENIDPRVVIPIATGDVKSFREVLAACGGTSEEVTEVKLKKGSLPTETREVYVLKG